MRRSRAGSGYTYEINFGGSGNRNNGAETPFSTATYPHFAQGMWELWRIHDVYETGTRLQVSGDDYHTNPHDLFDGTPALHPDAGKDGSNIPAFARMRALPDGEILDGTPIPAVVPLPGKALPLMPGEVVVVQKNANPGVDDDPNQDGIQDLFDSSQAYVVERTRNPGYPFWIGGVECGPDPNSCELGVVGQRAPTPPLDMLTETQARIAARLESGSVWKTQRRYRRCEWRMGRRSAASFTGRLPGCRRTHPDCVFQEQSKLSFYKEVSGQARVAAGGRNRH